MRSMPGEEASVSFPRTWPPPSRRRTLPRAARVTPVASGTAASVDRLLRLGSDAERGLLALDEPVLLVVCADRRRSLSSS